MAQLMEKRRKLVTDEAALGTHRLPKGDPKGDLKEPKDPEGGAKEGAAAAMAAVMAREELMYARVVEIRYGEYLRRVVEVAKEAEDEVEKGVKGESGPIIGNAIKACNPTRTFPCAHAHTLPWAPTP